MIWVKRSLPRRSPDRYPVGSTLTLRDGRVFEVVEDSKRQWVDPTFGHGGGNWEIVPVKRWIEVTP